MSFLYSFRITVLALFLLIIPVFSLQAAGEKEAALHKSAVELMDVGSALYNRGMYASALGSLQKAQENKQYLNDAEQKKLADLLAKATSAESERHKIFDQIKAADTLSKKNDFAGAAARLESVKDSKFLNKGERAQVLADLSKMQANSKERTAAMDALLAKSLKEYEAKNFDAAKKGFEEVANSGVTDKATVAQQYLAKMDTPKAAPAVASAENNAEDLLEEQPKAQAVAAEPVKPLQEAKPVAQAPVAAVEPTAAPVAPSQVAVPATPAAPGYIDRVLQQRNIQKSYTEAVVQDAINRAKSETAQKNYDIARDYLSNASRVVENNRMLLGDDAYKYFTSLLISERTNIDSQAQAQAQSLASEKQAQAVALQQQLRSQQEIERQQRVDELMKKAIALQRDQRYEDSLAQLDLLLAIDPHNEQATVMHRTLGDMVEFRKQLEVQAKINQQTMESMLEVDKANIPYSDEITYPKDWREISSRRVEGVAAGSSPADAEVYKQLVKVVDLSRFSPDMTFGDAIEVLRTSVEPALRIVVLWKDLSENADITRNTQINMEPVSQVPVGKALDLLLRSVSGGLVELGYLVEDGVITIATKTSLPEKLVQDSYDITDLLDPAANFESDLTQTGLGEITQSGGTGGGGGGGGGSNRQQSSSNRNQQDMTSETAVATRAQEVVNLIEQTIEPDKWVAAGGTGSMYIYAGKRLIVNQTPEIHKLIAKLIESLRSNLGQQVSIEARFLLVSEAFLEDIGVDADFIINAGDHWDPIQVNQGSINNVTPTSSLAGSDALNLRTGYGNIMDDLQASFLIKATQTHENTSSLEAPRVTVLSGESATMRVTIDKSYVSNIEFEQSSTTGDNPIQFITANQDISTLTSGVILNVTPTISADKKYVILRIQTNTTALLSLQEYLAEAVDQSGNLIQRPMFIPELETTEIQTRVSVPDKGTLLLGGQKITSEDEKESGVPMLSKIPVVGRLFSNRTTQREHRILLILVTPTIMLKDETEADAIAGLKENTM
ncbi:MAG: hypothetical protein A2Y07_05005 [Planctomycetes bacterium GWF2_50_10]|nr:MAG: hypothetical protein A2Y07_05005 [Planctomycetes bacterium GWF2_50_10]